MRRRGGRRRMKHRELLKVLLMPVLCAAVGGLLLLAVSLIPESAVHDNAARSAEQMDGMGQWVVLLDEEDPACTLDSYTDQQIIMESYTLSASDPSTVLLNPRVWLDREDQSGALAQAVSGQAYNNNYFRYWMGFRILYRPLLAVTSYFGILKIMAIAVFAALFCAGAYIGKRLGMAQALCFGAALALVGPATVMLSLQFSMCFLLAAVFVILTLKLEKSGGGGGHSFPVLPLRRVHPVL